MRQFLTLFLIFLCLGANGQHLKIFGTVTDVVSKDSIPFVNIRLLENKNLIKWTATDLNGQYLIDSLFPGDYTLFFECYEYDQVRIDSFKINSNREENIKLEKCIQNIRPCPKCQRVDQVLIIQSGIRLHINFKTNRKAKLYYKKIHKIGYEAIYESERNTLIRFYDTKRQEILENCGQCCKKLFCERDNIIF